MNQTCVVREVWCLFLPLLVFLQTKGISQREIQYGKSKPSENIYTELRTSIRDDWAIHLGALYPLEPSSKPNAKALCDLKASRHSQQWEISAVVSLLQAFTCEKLFSPTWYLHSPRVIMPWEHLISKNLNWYLEGYMLKISDFPAPNANSHLQLDG